MNVYISRLRQDGEWGDGNVVSAACKLYGRRILVYTDSSSRPASFDTCETRPVSNNEVEAPICIAYVAEVPGEVQTHYVSLVPNVPSNSSGNNHNRVSCLFSYILKLLNTD